MRRLCRGQALWSFRVIIVNQSGLVALATGRSQAIRLVKVVRMEARRAIKETSNPVTAAPSPSILTQDFGRYQVFVQQLCNFHFPSNSPVDLSTMVSPTVNKTNLHPSGVQSVAR